VFSEKPNEVAGEEEEGSGEEESQNDCPSSCSSFP
jgi:hypothetical protein